MICSKRIFHNNAKSAEQGLCPHVADFFYLCKNNGIFILGMMELPIRKHPGRESKGGERRTESVYGISCSRPRSDNQRCVTIQMIYTETGWNIRTQRRQL